MLEESELATQSISISVLPALTSNLNFSILILFYFDLLLVDYNCAFDWIFILNHILQHHRDLISYILMVNYCNITCWVFLNGRRKCHFS